MFSFFKRFKSGGNKAAETSPAPTESPASPDVSASVPPPQQAPVQASQPSQPSQPTHSAPAEPPLTPSDASSSLANSPSPSAPSGAPSTPIAPVDTPSHPVENTAHSEAAQAEIPTPDALSEARPVSAPQVTSAPVSAFESAESVAPVPPVSSVDATQPAPVAPTPAPVLVKDSHGEAIGEIVSAPAPAPAAKRSWLTRLKAGLSKTSAGLTGIFVGVKVDENLFEELESALLMSDAGVEATTYLLDALRKKVKAERLTEGEQVKRALHDLLVELLSPLEQSLVLGREAPLVVMIAGVNGAGKTTSIGKLAKHFQHYGQSVLLAAGDTFRAAAREQLAIWGERNNVAVVAQESGDPAAVVFDAVSAARARKIDIVMADTAGRLPTQLHLMEELKKIKRVLGKAADGAPHEVLLVIDANTGQNALAQVKAFDDALTLTGLIVTKLDGTAKGGILAAIARQRPVPVYFIGVGEKVEDLQPFSAREFADALLG
ncbi:signal recognition particle-docking protein FtsY [Pandoraea captiosa]|uniref:Signal recognition particle receptor FtsY n=1 Tax=Pandoraea captiosa TaxID=2508302 RepID=A0A5E4ZV90_9BURK|nr:signal recognition particle-docking protein FtsY [Pandoraea captiosa]VVE64727.1 signal recognition particle-docking protein FtsY [Pandoraea captiosa]